LEDPFLGNVWKGRVLGFGIDLVMDAEGLETLANEKEY
jgi:hypothetical protein